MAKDYVVWSNEHRAWWGPEHRGYRSSIADAGRYTRDEALAICIGARGGRRFNANPSEVPLLASDAKAFWPDDRPEWERERRREEMREQECHERTIAAFASGEG